MGSIRQEIRRVARQGPPPFRCAVSVESVTAVSDTFVRVAVRGDGLEAYRHAMPADAFKILLPPDGAGAVAFPGPGADGLPEWPEHLPRPVLRAFTVRRFDAVRSRIEFDVMCHDGGQTRSWLRGVAPGDVIGLAGMRHEFHPGDGVTRHVIVGDSSALPAVAAIVESLAPEVAASVYLAVDHESDRALVTARENVRLCWVSGGSPTGADSSLARAVRGRERPGGRVQAWLAAEAGVVRELRRWALDDLGVSRDDLHSAAYWKSGLDSTAADAVHLRRYQQQVASGADATDPDVREMVELGRG